MNSKKAKKERRELRQQCKQLAETKFKDDIMKINSGIAHMHEKHEAEKSKLIQIAGKKIKTYRAMLITSIACISAEIVIIIFMAVHYGK